MTYAGLFQTLSVPFFPLSRHHMQCKEEVINGSLIKNLGRQKHIHIEKTVMHLIEAPPHFPHPSNLMHSLLPTHPASPTSTS
jgi:hypothetical protein